MSTVSSPASLGGSVDLHVVDRHVLQVLAVGVGLQVLQQSEHDVDGLDWPSTESPAEFLGLAGSADTAVVSGEGDTPSLGEHVLEICFGLGERESLDGAGGLICVLIVDSQIAS